MNYTVESIKLIAAHEFAKYPVEKAWLLNPSYLSGTNPLEFVAQLKLDADIVLCLDVAADIEDIVNQEVIVRRIINNHMPDAEKVLVYES